MAMVNIPSTNRDPQYRYKMPRLISKLEGRGNGIKTRIVNMGDVARALNRPPQYATKWFGSELGAQSHYINKEGEGECCLINGSHDISAFQGVLDGFIDKYVCCGNCHLPEVDMYITKGVICGKCKACGWAHELDNKHRVAHFITKHPPDESGLRLKAHGGGKLEKKALKAFPEVDSDFGDFTDFDQDLDDFSDSGGSSFDERERKKHKKEKKEKKDKKKKKEKKEKKHNKEEKFEDDLSDEETNEETEEDDDETSAASTDKESADGEIEQIPLKEQPMEETTARQIEEEKAKAAKLVQPARYQKPRSGANVRGYGSPEIGLVIKTLKEYVKDTGESMSVEGFFDELRVAQLAEVFDHKMRLYVVLEATLLGMQMSVQSVLACKEHIEHAISSASMPPADVLWAFSAYIEAHPCAAKSFPMVLKTIYDEDWASESGILEYYNSDFFSDEPGFRLAREHADPFIKWLSTVESADEDEDA